MEEKLQEVFDEAKAAYPGVGASDRLEQLRAHIATCIMIVNHLRDESERMENYK